MKILTVSNYYPEHIGGIEFVAFNLVKRWRRHHEVCWIASDDRAHPHHCEGDDVALRAWNFTEERLGFPYPIPLGDSASRIFEQVKWSDVVHLHDCLYLANWITYFAARRFRKPILITQHAALASFPEAYKRSLQGLAYRSMGRLLLSHADEVVFISARVKNWFESWMCFRKQASFIPNGVDREIFFPPTVRERDDLRNGFGFIPEKRVLVFVGRFMPNKGVQVVRQLAEARPGFDWVMLGNGQLDPHEWNLPNIRVLPPQPQRTLRQYYAAADLFVLPSLGEGFPLAIQEALTCGLPVAVARETAEYVPDAPLVKLDVGSLPDMLHTLDQTLANPAKWAELVQASTTYARRWDWDQVADQYLELFAHLSQEQGSAR